MTKALNAETMIGLVLAAIGIVLLAHVHSLRPPDGLADAFRMVVDGDVHYIKEPYYSLYMAGSAVMALVGAVLVIVGLRKK